MTGREGVKKGKQRERWRKREKKKKRENFTILLYILYINLKNSFAPTC